MIERMFDDTHETIPSNLADLQPGPELGGVLACIDVDRVSPFDRVLVLEAHQRQRSFHDAEVYRAMTAIVDAMGLDDPRDAAESAAVEIQCALHLTRRATERELSFALDLQERLPQIWQALAGGEIDVWRAKVIADRTVHLSDDATAAIVGRVLDQAPTLTTGQLRARIDRLALEVDSESAAAGYEAATLGRRIVAQANLDGTGNLVGLSLQPHRLQAALRRVNTIARSLNTAEETRSMDQLRADVFLDLLVGVPTDAPAGTVHLHVDLDTLAALNEHPGDLNGYGPVISDIARQVAEAGVDGEWRYTVDDTATDSLVATGTTRRRPDTAMRRRVEARSRTCVFPGCRMPSIDCDIDHTVAYADGGPTSDCNLAPLCRHHHRIKHLAGWRYRPIGHWDYAWTSRLGHVYTTSGRSP
jgi:Domain of unknown function (DUF222)